MPYATLHGIRIHYDAHGEGDQVLRGRNSIARPWVSCAG